MSDPTLVDQNSVMQRLRAETRPAHDRIESIPFSVMMLEGRLPRERFAGQLACWLAIHGVLEEALRGSDNSTCRSVWLDGMARASHLRHDVACHGSPEVPDHAAAATLRTVAWIASIAASRPVSLLGCLYVLEGSKLGGAILRRSLDEAYQCGPEALSYFWASGASPMPDFTAFKGRMEQAITTVADRDAVVAAACSMFDHLTQVLEGLLDGLDPSAGSAPCCPHAEGSSDA